MTKYERALKLAEYGFFVFPLESGSKLPHIDSFPVKASRNPDQIKTWWHCPVTGQYQDFNIGISTSRFREGEALVVIDVDNKDGKDGSSVLFDLAMEGASVPATLEFHTPTGGRHLVYSAPEAVKQGVNVLGPGLDIRSSGGYIVAPGSEVGAGEYTLGVDSMIAGAPQWVIDRCGKPVERKSDYVETPPEVIDTDKALQRAIRYLENDAPEAVLRQGSNTVTYAIAAHVKDFGVTKEQCLDLMLSHWNETKSSPPWPVAKLERVINNAYHYGKDAPGAKAPEVEFSEPAVSINNEQPAEVNIGHPFEELNKEFAFVIAGGGYHILWETTDEHGNFRLEHLAPSAFHAKFAAKTMTVGKRTRPLTELWMEDKGRRGFDGIVFRPEQETDPRFYNLWRGFAVEPHKDGEPVSAQAQRGYDLFLDHAMRNVCNNDPTLFHWLMGYFAHMIQRPYEKPQTALVFRGSKGVGKNTIIERVGYLVGDHFLLTANKRYLTSNFNTHLESLLLLTLNEAFWSGDKEAEGILKELITGTEQLIEPKGKGTYKVANLIRVSILGNEDWLVPASYDERRFAVFDVGEGNKQDKAYFVEMKQGLEAGGYRLLLKYFLDFNLQSVNVDQAPNTEALVDQKHASLEPLEQWWLDCLSEGYLIGSDFGRDWPEHVMTERFRVSFSHYVRERNIRARLPDSRTVGRMIAKVVPQADRKRGKTGYYYELPPLHVCRQDWAQFIGGEVKWD